jgi:hypothetical protein
VDLVFGSFDGSKFKQPNLIYSYSVLFSGEPWFAPNSRLPLILVLSGFFEFSSALFACVRCNMEVVVFQGLFRCNRFFSAVWALCHFFLTPKE